jgi:general secretion pathway protein E
MNNQNPPPGDATSMPPTGAQGKVLAQFLGMNYVDRLPEPAPPRNPVRGDFDRIAGSWGRQFLTVPVGGDDSHVVVATADPLNVEAIDQLRVCYERPIKVLVTSPDEVTKAINSIRTSLMSDRSSNLADSDSKEDGDDISGQLKIDVTDSDDDDAPIIRYVNAIIFKASSERASDVHIEPFEDRLKVRFRVDGVLHDVASEDKSFQPAILSRVKVMAGLNIAEKRLPQDGRIGLKIAGKDVDIRVSTVPTQFGERIVMRLLDKSGAVLDINQLGVDERNLKLITKLLQKPNGIILVTGPTGSGKTTTLYACLTYINQPDLNILTVEDPIEYQLDGVGQMQVNPKIDFTFASGLRAILRQDPDVVMVGEIRDGETAEIAIQASLTGHLVLSTLHTNDSAGAVTRLVDMGVEPFLVSSSLLAVVAQRLVRRLCKHCKVPGEITDEEIRELGIDPAKVPSRQIFRPGNTECPHCQGAGYSGRLGIHEILVIDDDLRGQILQRMDSNSIRTSAIKRGFSTLRMDGARKIFMGQTSVEEVILASHDDFA